MHVLTRTSTTRGPETEPFSTHNIIQLAFIWHNVGILLCKNGEPEQRRERKKREQFVNEMGISKRFPCVYF